MVGFGAIGVDPIGVGPRTSGNQIFAALAASGLAALSAVSGPAQGALSTAGAGSVGAVSGPASGSLSSAGAGTLAGNLTAKGNMVFNTAGAGALSGAIFAKANAGVAAAGAGAAAIKMLAKASSALNAAGSGGIGTTDNPTSIASLMGFSGFVAVSYAFFADADKRGPLDEPRSTKVRTENRIAVVPYENRVYQLPTRRNPRAPNRRRVV